MASRRSAIGSIAPRRVIISTDSLGLSGFWRAQGPVASVSPSSRARVAASQLHAHDQFPHPSRRIENVAIRQQASLQQLRDDGPCDPVRLDAARGEVSAGEFRRDATKSKTRALIFALSRSTQSQTRRIAPMLVAVEETDLKGHAVARERSRQAPRLDHDAIVDHG